MDPFGTLEEYVPDPEANTTMAMCEEGLAPVYCIIDRIEDLIQITTS